MFVKEYIYSTQWVKYELSHTNELPLDWFVCALSDFFSFVGHLYSGLLQILPKTLHYGAR